jgi:hypothetical protein
MCGPALVGYAIVRFVSPLAVARLLNGGAEIVLSIDSKASKRCRGEADRQLIVVFQSQRQNFVVVKLNRHVDRSARQGGKGSAEVLDHLLVKVPRAPKHSKLTVHDVLFRNTHLVIDKTMLLDIIA